MGMFSRGNTKAALRSVAEIQALTAPAPERSPARRAFVPVNIPGPLEDTGYRLAGLMQGMNEGQAMRQVTVYACVRILSDGIAGLPQGEYRKQGDLRVPLPASPVIASPDPELTDFEYVQQVVTSMAIRGNNYEVVTNRDKFEYPVARKPVHPDMVQVERSKNDGRADYKIGGVSVPREDIIHIKRLSLAGSLEGLSPIGQAAATIGLALTAEAYGSRWFNDSANPSAALETEQTLNEIQMRQVMENWVATHGGRRHPALLSGGLKYKPISINPAESQFLETRAFQRGEIAMMYGIPPHMLGDTEKSTSWGAGIEQQSLGFVKFALLPWIQSIEASYSKVLLPRGRYMRFNLAGLLRADLMTRYQSYKMGREGGWLNSDEIRAMEDWAPIPDGLGQDYMQPLNYAPLGSVPEPTQTPAKPPADGGDQ